MPQLPEGLTAFIEGALVKDPDDRLSDWGKIDAMLRGGDAAEAALDTFDETIIRLRFKPGERVKVDRALETFRRKLQGVPWTDVAVAEITRTEQPDPEPARKSWRERLGMTNPRITPNDIVTRIPMSGDE